MLDDASKMSEEADNCENGTIIKKNRLPLCEVCASKDSIYTCPKCALKTCSLPCVNIHKKELKCDGLRDRTRFIYMNNFTDLDMFNDYKLLEECSRFLYGKKRNVEKKYTQVDRYLPPYLSKLKYLAKKRGTVLLFMLENFSRRKINSTRARFNKIRWRIEWIFTNANPQPLKIVDSSCDEEVRLSTLISQYVEPKEGKVKDELVYYQSAGLSQIRLFLKAEKIKGCDDKVFELDMRSSLRDNLAGKCIVEFPIIFVMLKDHSYSVQVVDPDEILSAESEKKQPEVKPHNSSSLGFIKDYSSDEEERRKRPPKELATEKFIREENMKIENEILREKKKKPRNLLFVTGYSSEEDEDMEIGD